MPADPTTPRLRTAARLAAGIAALSIAAGACAPGSSSAVGSHPPFSPEAATMGTPAESGKPASALTLASAAFADGAAIPREYTCRGDDVSPPLAWRGIPAGTAAVALLVDDPDGRDWVHWAVLDMPGRDGELPRAVPPAAGSPQQGRNDFGKVGYGGPCPPSGNHHYRFTLYALGAPLGLPGHPDGPAVRAALARADVLARVTLVGTFRA